jgi:hypothetical protein
LKATVQSGEEASLLALPKGLPAWKPGTELGVVFFGLEGLLALPTEGVSYFAGSLQALGMGEVFGQVLAGIRTGKLIWIRGTRRKTVSFRDGQVTFASSTEPHERLGRTLLRLSLVTPAQLDTALGQVKPGRKLGQVLTQSGTLSASSLYAGMAYLVREIVLGLCMEDEGDFLFIEGKAPTEDVIRLPERTRDLVLEGLKRASELSRWRRRFPPEQNLSQGPRPVDDESAQVWTLVATAGTVGALRTAFAGSDYDLYAALDGLVGAGGVLLSETAVRPLPAAQTAPAASALERYAALVKAICGALESAGRPLDDLRAFLQDPLPGMEVTFAGVTLSPGGVLDAARIISNTSAENPALARAQAYEALDAFVSYALFSAKNVLPAELAETLGREFRRLHEGGHP